MRLAAPIVLTTLLVPGAALAADWEGIYRGTLGKSEVLVQLVEPLDDMEGETKRETSRYSYLPKARDLNLVMTQNGKTLKFDETPQQFYEFAGEGAEKVITGRWSLTITGEKAKGTWISPDGKKKLPIALTHVPDLDEAERNTDLNIWSDTYNVEWLKSVAFTDAGTARTMGAVEVRWAQDSVFGAKYPVLGAFPDAARKEKANAMLMKLHRRSLANYRDCKNGVPLAWNEKLEEAEFSYDIVYASPTLLSVSEAGSVNCGGAHPSNEVTTMTFDLTAPLQIGGNLADLTPEGFGRVLKLANKEERIAFERHALGLWEAGAAADKEMGPDCADGSIEYAPEGEKDFSLSFTEKGLAVARTDFPHALAVCQFTDFNPTIIPWADLKPWLKPGQTLLGAEISP